MRIEVELLTEAGDTGETFRAIAVAYPEVTATGRTEKEALGLLMEAMGRFMKKKAADGA
jgi:predicted RNase H-like HicB family nuclease